MWRHYTCGYSLASNGYIANKFSICQQIYSRRFAETWDIAPKAMGSFLSPHTNRSFAAKTLPKIVKSIPSGGHGHGGQAEGRYRDQCQTGRAFLGSCTLLVSIEFNWGNAKYKAKLRMYWAKLGIQQWFLSFTLFSITWPVPKFRNYQFYKWVVLAAPSLAKVRTTILILKWEHG